MQPLQTFIKIIDNKKVSVTNQEWELYQSICRSYDRPAFKGEELFKNLFESDEDGIITFLKPPSTHFTSMEVFMFVASIMIHQHIRQMYLTVSFMCGKVETKIIELNK